MSMLSQAFSVIIDRGISATGHVRELVDGINAIGKLFFQLISTVQLPGAKHYETKMVMHTGTCTCNVNLARKCQKYLYNAARKHGLIYQGK